jgi:hypothetical protein
MRNRWAAFSGGWPLIAGRTWQKPQTLPISALFGFCSAGLAADLDWFPGGRRRGQKKFIALCRRRSFIVLFLSGFDPSLTAGL